MIRNFLKIGYRNILKNKLSSIINIVGLGIAFGCTLVVFAFLDRLYHLDDCHVKGDRIYYLESVMNRDGRDQVFGNVPMALAPSIKEDLFEVEDAVRIQYQNVDFRYGDKVFNENVIFVDDGYFNLFSFPIKYGSGNVLSDKNKIVLSENTAKKYFGKEEAIGKPVSILYSINGREYKESYIVGAVAHKFPYSASLRFNILVPFENRKNLGLDDDNDWTNFAHGTFVMLKDPGSIDPVINKLNKYVSLQNQSNPEDMVQNFLFDPLPGMAANAYGKEAMLTYGTHPTAKIVLTIIAIFIMILAVFNYINIAIVSVTSRLKEIGMRKVIGSTQKQIILQFMSENALLCFISLFFGWILANTLFLPGFNTIGSSSSPMIFEYDNPRFWIFVISIFCIVGFGSAAYPAFYVSRFKIINIFKDKQKLGSRNVFTKLLLSIQFIISFITISLAVVFVLNGIYNEKRDWGYDKEQTVVIPLTNEDQYEELRNEFIQNPDIKMIAGSKNHIGWWVEDKAVEFENNQYVCKKIEVGYNYLETLGIRMQMGRFFEENSATDMQESIIVNEAFVKSLNLEGPIGTRLMIDGFAYYIIGKADDFHFVNFRHDIKPLFFQLSSEESFNYIAFETLPGKASEAESYAKNVWKKLYPDNTYEGFLQNSAFDAYFKENRGISSLMIAIASIAMLISCMGLFGLVSLLISKQLKEFSIRKVLGATIFEVGKQINLYLSCSHYSMALLTDIIPIDIYGHIDCLNPDFEGSKSKSGSTIKE